MIINKVQVYNYFIDIVRMDNINRSTAGVIDILSIYQFTDIKSLFESRMIFIYRLNTNLAENTLDYYENI